MGSCGKSVLAREAIEGLDDLVDYLEFDGSDPDVQSSWGISDGVYVEGEPYRAYEPPWTSDVLRRDLLELIEEKGAESKNAAA
jgi:hypothetical protein